MPFKTNVAQCEYKRKWYQRNRKKVIAEVAAKKVLRKKRFHEFKATLRCELCPESHPACLDFHHCDPETKTMAVSLGVVRGWTWTQIMREVAKCRVLCANCHRKVHAGVV